MNLEKTNSLIHKAIFNIQNSETELLDEAFKLASPKEFNKKYGMALTKTAREIMQPIEDLVKKSAIGATRLRDPERTPKVTELVRILSDEVIEDSKRIPPSERKELLRLIDFQIKRWREHAKGLMQAQGTRAVNRRQLRDARDVRQAFVDTKKIISSYKGGGFMKKATKRSGKETPSESTQKTRKTTTSSPQQPDKPNISQPTTINVELPTKWTKGKVKIYLYEPASKKPVLKNLNGYSFGVFALHKTAGLDDNFKIKEENTWTLTHAPSGMAVMKNLPSKKMGMELVSMLIGTVPDLEKVKDTNKFRKLAPMFRYILQAFEALKTARKPLPKKDVHAKIVIYSQNKTRERHFPNFKAAHKWIISSLEKEEKKTGQPALHMHPRVFDMSDPNLAVSYVYQYDSDKGLWQAKKTGSG